MVTETSDPSETTADATETPPDRPEFRGCVICYSAEMALYAVRKARR